MAVVERNRINKTELLALKQIRAQIRSNIFTENTSGLMPGFVQGNVVIMTTELADEFIEFCNLNDKPCPVIGFSKAGDPSIPNLGRDIDIRIDVPEYLIFKHGEFSHLETDIGKYWQKDSIAIVRKSVV